MASVKLREVIKRANTKVDKDNTNLIYYVGGEHIESENIRVHKRGLIAGSTIGPMFYYGFKAGDFLLVSRNPHLKKAGLVNFDGICSEKTFVLETVDPTILLPEFLPFVLQNKRFWDYAYQHRHGSTNTFINWSTLSDYEFELPDLETQRKLAAVLWSINDTMESYKKLISATDELVKSQFIEMFGDPVTNPLGWELVRLDDLCSSIVRGPFGSALKVSYFVPKTANTVKVYEQKNAIQSSADLGTSYITQEKYEELLRFRCGPGDILMSCSGTIGCLYQLPEDAEPGIINQALCKFRLNDRILPIVFLTFMRQSVDQLETKGTGIQNIGAVSYIKNMKIPLAPHSVQEQFAAFVRQSDKSKFELEQALAELTATYKRIIAENLG